MLHRRHTLAHIDPIARARLLPALIEALPAAMRGPDIEARIEHVLISRGIPGIVCRPTAPCGEGEGQVGFAFPFRVGAQRVRAAVPVARSQITRFTSPWAVMDRAVGLERVPHRALTAIHAMGRVLDVPVGLIGSAALEAMSGLPYVEAASDLDLVVEGTDAKALASFWQEIQIISTWHKVKVDVEIDFGHKYGVKMAEYFSDSASVLAKTIHGVEVMNKELLTTNIAILAGVSAGSVMKSTGALQSSLSA
ncbi:hypothetical protein F11_06865 [Rhodospirillum rubrum F11]|uniref:Phosphoribosyl-dephospho-CoA transferase n=1 Tax=Rhodospirillum rubrum (strain ATCC 11170 / ATH 1.1.1 / DSM 467 / LMG 4362 / NCIMB 8255 / S1) TaxID=269796 RepID=Q2RUR7_RHORT|nr:malonate decarboxylase holo-[acyl-carrier-protein] synthase [Rhodospirillum rubrum]ABC22128.1 hypothetical protein Rru_A1327 [Rhodospirillum rubrum ATCC 11170]AEO47843.1 hypothetical protein F11_06865 [Rhodospirillum rubrum F11]MBK5953717.1 malonate decarboxylase holo-[acyl-carrier-protein] synthase [Rhodospirillum rubrum]QXG81777.1 malonate decarboxylase holo-[acyl-carrier-protein] synthase [Rhodospirillum rubrum]